MVLHHIHCSCSNTCAALTSSQALLFHHMRCCHCFTCAVWPAGIELTTTDLDFFFDAKRKRKEKTPAPDHKYLIPRFCNLNKWSAGACASLAQIVHSPFPSHLPTLPMIATLAMPYSAHPSTPHVCHLCNAVTPDPVWKLLRGAVPERGPSEIRALLWGGVA